MKQIPLLRAEDVELRVGQLLDGACILLAYKDARVDMRVLDEVFGWQNWKREHVVIDGQLFCTVSVWDEIKGQWISKQDVGTESRTEAEKGRASDSFKRACFNFGIGRELYAAPFLYIKLDKEEINGRNVKTKFTVKEMEFDKDKGEFTKFTVVDNKGKVRYELKGKKAEPKKPAKAQEVETALGGTVQPLEYVQKNEQGKTVILSRKDLKTLRVLETMKLNELNAVINEPLYSACHDEARWLMAALET